MEYVEKTIGTVDERRVILRLSPPVEGELDRDYELKLTDRTGRLRESVRDLFGFQDDQEVPWAKIITVNDFRIESAEDSRDIITIEQSKVRVELCALFDCGIDDALTHRQLLIRSLARDYPSVLQLPENVLNELLNALVVSKGANLFFTGSVPRGLAVSAPEPIEPDDEDAELEPDDDSLEAFIHPNAAELEKEVDDLPPDTLRSLQAEFDADFPSSNGRSETHFPRHPEFRPAVVWNTLNGSLKQHHEANGAVVDYRRIEERVLLELSDLNEA